MTILERESWVIRLSFMSTPIEGGVLIWKVPADATNLFNSDLSVVYQAGCRGFFEFLSAAKSPPERGMGDSGVFENTSLEDFHRSRFAATEIGVLG